MQNVNVGTQTFLSCVQISLSLTTISQVAGSESTNQFQVILLRTCILQNNVWKTQMYSGRKSKQDVTAESSLIHLRDMSHK